jgi:hypothetical protein
MAKGKHQFGIGLVVGILLAALFFMYFAPRYKTFEEGGTLYKHDRWSGESWRFDNNHWEKVVETQHNWKDIDSQLREALKVPETEKARKEVLKRLRERYPGLKEVNDDNLLERIKHVYSKELMIGHYLQTIVNLEEAEKGKESVSGSQ